MVRTQLKMLVAVLAAAGLVTSAPAQISFIGGSSYVEATGGIPPFNGANALYQQTLNTPILGSSGSAMRNGSVNALGVSHSSSAMFSHSVGTTMAAIQGTATANRSGTPSQAGVITGAFGLSAPNNPAQGGTTPTAPVGYGYLTNFNIASPGAYILDFDWTPTGTTPAGAGNQAYSDFMGYLWDQTRNIVWAVGGFLDNTGNASSTAIGEPDPSTLPVGATVVPFTLDPRTLNLGSGQYTLYLQGQAYVQGSSGTQFANTNAAVRLQQVIPEPLSVAVFGGLLVGGLVARRRFLKA